MGPKIARFLIFILIRLFVRLEVQGIEHLPASGAYIITSNHVGRLDAALVYYLLQRDDIVMLAAEKYRESALFRWFAKHLNAIFIDRYNADFKALRAVLGRLSEGYVLALAPEGTRSQSGQLIPARPGAAYLAAKSGAPVLPVGITGSEDSRVKAGLRRLRRPHVVARIGPTFTLPPVPNRGREEALQQYSDELMCRIALLLPESYHGAYKDHPRLKELEVERALAGG